MNDLNAKKSKNFCAENVAELYLNDVKDSIKKVCSFKSVQEAPVGNMPFGEEVAKALDYMLSLGKSFGFKAVNYDNYVGEIVWEGTEDGKNAKTLGVLCHLDVVKPGRLSDWESDPFTPEERDGRIYARGATDDKGPAVVSLYMMKALKDSGFTPRHTVKLILGCNEETGWACMEHYKKVAKMPDFGFSPDGDFPVLYAEKGIFAPTFEFDCSDKIKIAEGGEMVNVVCDYAYCIAPVNDELLKKHGLKLNGEKIESTGLAAHGSTPEKGKNAIAPLIAYLADMNLLDKKVYDFLFADCLGLKKVSDETGFLTMSPDILRAENGKMRISVDFRYPATLPPTFITEAADKIGKYDKEKAKHQLPLFNDRNSFLIKTLLNIYNEESGENETPKAIGGGTYARALPLGAAFGPEMKGEDARIHQPNEFISIKCIEFLCRTYFRAIKELSE
ncbi:MAG: Sapep family Mn(2+)-dependent dipeptidase [Candidatus Borkfalkiaceae bacterium]|nr:Sapep family Mn(2+)-dependent dipeptidase [Christensenellaceae bacterium]